MNVPPREIAEIRRDGILIRREKGPSLCATPPAIYLPNSPKGPSLRKREEKAVERRRADRDGEKREIRRGELRRLIIKKYASCVVYIYGKGLEEYTSMEEGRKRGATAYGGAFDRISADFGPKRPKRAGGPYAVREETTLIGSAMTSECTKSCGYTFRDVSPVLGM